MDGKALRITSGMKYLLTGAVTTAGIFGGLIYYFSQVVPELEKIVPSQYLVATVTAGGLLEVAVGAALTGACALKMSDEDIILQKANTKPTIDNRVELSEMEMLQRRIK